MSLIIDNDGTVSMYQGDYGELVFSGLNPETSYTVCFAIQDAQRNIIGQELHVSVSNSDTVTFVLTPDYTDLLTVPKQKPFEIYYYGVKACETDSLVENTLFIANGTYGDLNKIIVYPRKVKGVEENDAT